MKIFISLFCFIAIINYALSVSTMEIMKSIRECRKENNCQENLIKKLTQHEMPETEEGFNAMFCTGEKLKLITNNQVDVNVLKSVLLKLNFEESKAAAVANACQLQLSATHAEAAKSLLTCIQNNSM